MSCPLDESTILESTFARAEERFRPSRWKRSNALRWLGLPAAIVVCAFVATVVLAPPKAQARAQTNSGSDLYAQSCAACHQPNGEGVEGTFPPLAGNPAAADAAYVTDVIQNGRSGPLEVFGVSYDGVMPPIPSLTGADLDAVVALVVEMAGADVGTAPPPDTEPESDEPYVANADRGEDLFLGSTRLDSGGAACASCHTAGSIGNLGGTSLGPDLTAAYDNLGGDVGLTAWLGNPPAPTMAPIFSDKPMNDDEVADLVSYLATTSGAEPPNDNFDALLLAGIAGLIALIGGMAIAWRGMRQTYLQRLRSKR